MSGKTGIQWTDVSWNPVVGCTRVSAGCDKCYAFDFHDRRMYAPYIKAKREGREVKVAPQFHQPFSKVQLMPERLDDPLHWRKPRKVFVNSMSDLFHPAVPDEYIERVFNVMSNCPQHTFQVLTKRAERMRDWTGAYHDRFPRFVARGEAPWPNVWLGVSVEHQQAADERIPLLMQTPAAVRFLSCEPLLGPVDLMPHIGGAQGEDAEDGFIDWCIIGGESGAHARAMKPLWAEWLVAQCRAAGVAVFCKQMGTVWAKAHHASDRHGSNPLEWPEALRIREFPVTPQTPQTPQTAAHADEAVAR